ncbi:hypothetical protein J6590_018208 [Homalodisca vitripennis]|nr:hypothetical protein J6590_018208 [Homalodisca vitripennis]
MLNHFTTNPLFDGAVCGYPAHYTAYRHVDLRVIVISCDPSHSLVVTSSPVDVSREDHVSMTGLELPPPPAAGGLSTQLTGHVTFNTPD